MELSGRVAPPKLLSALAGGPGGITAPGGLLQPVGEREVPVVRAVTRPMISGSARIEAVSGPDRDPTGDHRAGGRDQAAGDAAAGSGSAPSTARAAASL